MGCGQSTEGIIPNIDIPNSANDALKAAFKSNYAETAVKKALEMKADVNAKVHDSSLGSCRPLHLAVKTGNDNVVQMILKAGGDPHAVDSKGETTLHLAAKENHPSIIEMLVTAGVPVDVKSDDNYAPLNCAVLADKEEAINKLIELGADINGTGNQEKPLITAAKTDNPRLVEKFLRMSADTNGAMVPLPNGDKVGLLEWAVNSHHTNVINLLDQSNTGREGGDGEEHKEPAADQRPLENYLEDRSEPILS